MMRMFKYPVPGGLAPHEFDLAMHGVNPTIRYFGVDPTGSVSVWAEVNPKDDLVPRKFYLIGTGHDIPEVAQYIGSCKDRIYMWHLYMDPPHG